MKKTILVIALIIMYNQLISGKNFNPPDTYSFTHNGKNYEVVKEQMTWENASTFAVGKGAYLVEINSLEEQIAIHDAIINGAGVSEYYTYVANGGGIAYVWIGATDQYQEGVWLWDGNNDGSGVSFWTGQGQNGANNGSVVDGAYHNWGGKSIGFPNEPDNWGNSQHYAAIGLTGWPGGTTALGIAGEWNDIIGTSPLYFVIEYDGNVEINDNIIETGQQYQVYPNPTSSFVKLTNSESIKAIEVFNIRGQKIIQTTINKVDLSDYPKGLYFMKITDNRHSVIKKVILK